MEVGLLVLSSSILASAFVIAAAIKAAVETTKNCNVNWNPTVYLKRGEDEVTKP